jgi:hypothetical protein
MQNPGWKWVQEKRGVVLMAIEKGKYARTVQVLRHQLLDLQACVAFAPVSLVEWVLVWVAWVKSTARWSGVERELLWEMLVASRHLLPHPGG